MHWLETEVAMKNEITRRRFLVSGASLAAVSALHLPGQAVAAADLEGKKHFVYDGSTYPYPIPWLDKNGSHNQPAGPNNEPSHIYHFKGKIARCADFIGMGTDNKGNRLAFGSPTTDNDIMQGEYYTGRTEHKGTFAHLWVTLFRGQVAPANQVHDFHPPVGFCGLYWVVPVSEGALTFSDDGRMAELHMKGIEIIDQPKWPQFKADAIPARMDIRIVWTATDEKILYNDPQKQFRVQGYKAISQLEAAVEVPSIGFSWKSDPLKTSKCNFAIIGNEVNGKYYVP
jgi:hypothetical protein